MLDSGMADDSKKIRTKKKKKSEEYLKRGRKVGGANPLRLWATLNQKEVAQSLMDSSRANEQVFIQNLGGGCGTG